MTKNLEVNNNGDCCIKYQISGKNIQRKTDSFECVCYTLRKIGNKLINHSPLQANKFVESGRKDSDLGYLNTGPSLLSLTDASKRAGKGLLKRTDRGGAWRQRRRSETWKLERRWADDDCVGSPASAESSGNTG